MRVPVLTYHAVLPLEGARAVRGTVDLGEFREQVGWLVRRGYTALSLDGVADLLEGGSAQVRRPVALTFDDGYRCAFEHALPVLEDAGFTATLFVVTAAVGGTTDWYVKKGGRPFEHADWSELERARERGFEIGSHGAEHRRLAEADAVALRDEVHRSREEVVKRLGRCEHFAYPFGSVAPEAEQAVRDAGYRTGCTTQAGLNSPGQPLERLRRQNVGRNVTPARFRRRVGRWW